MLLIFSPAAKLCEFVTATVWILSLKLFAELQLWIVAVTEYDWKQATCLQAVWLDQTGWLQELSSVLGQPSLPQCYQSIRVNARPISSTDLKVLKSYVWREKQRGRTFLLL